MDENTRRLIQEYWLGNWYPDAEMLATATEDDWREDYRGLRDIWDAEPDCEGWGVTEDQFVEYLTQLQREAAQ